MVQTTSSSSAILTSHLCSARYRVTAGLNTHFGNSTFCPSRLFVKFDFDTSVVLSNLRNFWTPQSHTQEVWGTIVPQ